MDNLPGGEQEDLEGAGPEGRGSPGRCRGGSGRHRSCRTATATINGRRKRPGGDDLGSQGINCSWFFMIITIMIILYIKYTQIHGYNFLRTPQLPESKKKKKRKNTQTHTKQIEWRLLLQDSDLHTQTLKIHTIDLTIHADRQTHFSI